MPVTLAGLATGGALMGAKTAYDSYQTDKAMRTQQKYFERNQQKAYENERELLRDSSPLQKSGLMAAGFSPSILAGVSPATPSVPAAPMGEALANKATSLGDLASFAMLENQTKVADAQADLLNAQTAQQQLETGILSEENEVVGEAVKANLEEQIQIYNSLGLDSSKLEQDYDALVENGAGIGTLNANIRALKLRTDSVNSFTNQLEKLLSQDVVMRQIQGGVAEDLAKMPETQRDLMKKEIALKLAERYYMTTSGDFNRENLKKVAVEMSKLESEIHLMTKQGRLTDAQANSISNADLNTLIDNGEIGKAIIAGSTTAVKEFSHGAGIGAGVAVGSRLGGSAVGAAGNLTRLGRFAGSRSAGRSGGYVPTPKKLHDALARNRKKMEESAKRYKK